jgi:hypothetical protein
MRHLTSIAGPRIDKLIEAARDMTPVAGLTHNFYRYPARFSPKFVRATIEAFSAPGDLVLDPFMGGGTTLVEAMAAGRHAVGADISSLAAFIAQAKTTIYSDAELQRLSHWTSQVTARVNMHRPSHSFREYMDAGYLRNLEGTSTWRLRKAIEQALACATALNSIKLETFARCAVLRTAQWALDGRKNLPSIPAFRETLANSAREMIQGARELRLAVKAGWGPRMPIAHCLTRTTAGLESEPLLGGVPKPRLVLMSPPYPGVHVLYHRWQVDGRKETPAPFWIANKLDGAGASYYTMGDRQAYQQQPYFKQLRQSLRSIAAICTKDTTVVQVVAFSEPRWQLPRYLAATTEAGFSEFFLSDVPDAKDARLWRTVPNRKWHANQKGRTSGSNEVVLFHRLK